MNANTQATRTQVSSQSQTSNTTAGSSRNTSLRGMDYESQAASLEPASAGPPNIKFAYSESTLAKMASGDAAAAAVLERFRQFEMSDTKDGVRLTDEQRAVLAVQVLRESGVNHQEQKVFMTRVFFGHGVSSAELVDKIYTLELTGGGLTIRFSSQRGSVEPLVFAAPPVYEGKDDNLRGRRVEAVKHGMQDEESGRIWAIEEDSFIFAEKERIEQHFLMTIGKEFASLSPSEREASSAFRSAYHEYTALLAREHVGKIVAKLEGRVLGYAADNPDATLAMLVQQVVGMTLNMKDPDFFRYPHAEMRVEDEAIIELLLAKVGIEGSVSSDDFGDLSRLTDKRSKPSPTTGKETEVTPKPVSGTTENLPRDNALVRYLDGIAGTNSAFHVGPDSKFYAALGTRFQPEWDDRGLGASPCVAKGTGLIPTTHLSYFLPLAGALRVWADAELNQGDVTTAKASFESAAKAFMAAPAQRGGLTIG